MRAVLFSLFASSLGASSLGYLVAISCVFSIRISKTPIDADRFNKTLIDSVRLNE